MKLSLTLTLFILSFGSLMPTVSAAYRYASKSSKKASKSSKKASKSSKKASKCPKDARGPPKGVRGVSSNAARGVSSTFRIEECAVELNLSCTTPDGTPCEIIRDLKSECDERPSFMEFKFSGGTCDMTTNQQNGKFVCHDFGSIDNVNGGAYIVVESKRGSPLFSATVAKGQRFKVGNGYNKLDANVAISIYSHNGGSLLQKMNIHTSCSEPLRTNDTFGALSLMGFGTNNNGYQAADNEFLINYEVANIYDTIALLEGVIFYMNGNEVVRTYLDLTQLQPGETFARSELLELTASSMDPVELSATLYAKSLSAITCNTDDAIMIPVVEPEPEPEPIKCEGGFPYAFKFKFTGGVCAVHQTFWCEDHNEIGDWARIIVGDEDFKELYFEGDVKKGHEFVVMAKGAFKGYIAVKVMTKDYCGQWVVAQFVKFVASCQDPLYPLYFGDIFGAIEVAGWKIKGHDSVNFPLRR